MRANFVMTVALLAASQLALAALPVQTWRTSRGSRVLFVEDHNIPMLDVKLVFDAGGRRVPFAKAGLASLTAGSLDAGAGDQDENQLADAFADLGASFGVGSSMENVGAGLRTLSFPSNREPALQLMADILATPTFPQAALERKKANIISGLKQEMTQPAGLLQKALTRLEYGAHPYGISAVTSPETVAGLTRDDVLAFYNRHYGAQGAVLALMGDVSRPQAEAIAEQLTRRLPAGEALPPLPAVQTLPAQTERIAHPANQATIALGMPVLKRHDPDYYTLILGDYILGGGGFESRLMHEVREKRGLVYGVSSGFAPMEEAGEFEISLQTKREQADEALAVVRDVLRDFIANGPTAAEVQSAKDNLIGGFAMRTDSNAKILDWLAIIGFYKLPLGFLDEYPKKLEKISAADIRAAFQRRIKPEALSTVLVAVDEPGKADAPKASQP